MRRSIRVQSALKWLIAFLLVFFVVKFFADKFDSLYCDENDSARLLDKLCADYKRGAIAGNLCQDLCISQKLKYKKCLNHREGKKVFLMNCDKGVCESWRSVTAVFKSRPNHITFEEVGIPRLKNGSLTAESMTVALSIMKKRYEEMKHADIQEMEGSFFSHIWSMNFDEFVRYSKIRSPELVALESIWSLIEQDEYLFTKLTQELPYIPKMYGTCGSFYLLEYAPHGNALATYWKTAPWDMRRRLAIQFLEIATTLDKDYNEPVHVCDIKEDNFGVGDDNNVKLLDLDTLFFDTSMMSILQQPKCNSHAECDFFDCHGMCNLEENRCGAVRTNNNLQSICEDVLIDKATNLYQGLLHHPPDSIATELKEALHQCAYPDGNFGELVRNRASQDTLEEIRRLLKISNM